jgi:hypothetical protein
MPPERRPLDAESYSRGFKDGLADALKIFQQQIDAAQQARPIQIILPPRKKIIPMPKGKAK